MGFLGYCAIIWLCFPPWPYMQQGVEGNKEPIPFLNWYCWYVELWLPSVLASFCLHLPLGNKVRESFSLMRKIKAAAVVYPEEEDRTEGVRVCLWHRVRAGKCRAVGSPWPRLHRLQASRHSFCGALSRALSCLQGKFKKQKEYVQVGNCC